MDAMLLQPATAAADMIRRKQISSRELTHLVLAHIEAVNPTLNAVVDLRPEAALRDAGAADQAPPRGPFHGVPMTIKDSFNVAGLRTTWGNPAFKDFIADTDATVVQRLVRAGAIIIGKTNVPFMLGDFGQTANDVYGATNNPWDISRSPGGSTGGGAAALAAGMTFLEYGSDLVGSIRIPASFCGVYGLRPSVEIVPLTGFAPPGTPSAPSDMMYLSSAGPLARSARDLRAALQATAGPEAPATNAYAWHLAPPRHTRLEDFRVGVVLDHPHAPVSSEITAVLAGAVDALTRAGTKVVEGWPDGVDPVQQYEAFGFQVQWFFASQEPGARFARAAEIVDQEHRRMAARAAWGAYFNDVDVFLCPANFTPAFPHDRRPFDERTITTPEGERPYVDQPFWIAHAALAGLPAVVAPIGQTQGGLPAGAQIIGPLYEDGTALAFAELLAGVIGGYQPPPITP
jgi:amidase